MKKTRYTITTKGNRTTVMRIPGTGRENLPLASFVYVAGKDVALLPARLRKPRRMKKR
ncbi:MAG TPA: hypothetical protein VFD43_07330 [Planctomycetota bacterium]|nr:hypothetical protein [Planctomycetota bacterium]